MFIDTHCHLDATAFDPDRAAVIARAHAAGVMTMVVPAVEAGGFAALEALAGATPGVARAFGLHPLFVDRAQPADLDLLAERLDQPSVVAVGEIGLDGYVSAPDLAAQRQWFAAQLDLAHEFDLPVILHVRHAVDAVIQLLRRARVRGGIAHAFNGSRQQADQLLGMGIKLGFGGTLTFAGSRRIRALAAGLPEDAIVLETDAPDIPPSWARGQRNEPAAVARIAAELAALRGSTVEDVAAMTSRNARAALPRLEAVSGGA
ncbi:MAG: TatD family hydrolase [Rhodocyclaceae bacterium]|nr:TatD family hydrolase [Rhodocyclaceae bacterium]